MFKLFSLLSTLLIGLNACTHQPAIPLSVRTDAPLPSIAAEFETTVAANDGHAEHRYRWRFFRNNRQIETHNLHDDSGEIWSKFSNGDIGYQRLFHVQQRVIDYLPGDLKAIDTALDWLALSSLISPSQQRNLIADDREEILGRSATHYVSQDLTQVSEILWLEQDQIPAMMRQQSDDHLITTRLVAIYPLTQSPWLRPDSHSYRITDFADLGDNENDTFIQSILPKLKGGHSHGH